MPIGILVCSFNSYNPIPKEQESEDKPILCAD